MKVDKEFLIKNHFWILLFTAAGLALIGWLLLLVTVPGTVNTKRDQVDKAWKAGKDYSKFKHPKFVEIAQKEADDRNKERIGIHEKLYTDQVKEARLNTWPRKMVEVHEFDFSNGKYATEIVLKATSKASEVKKLLNELTNDATHVNGKLLAGEGDVDFIKIETKDKKVFTILQTPTVKVTDEGAKEDAKKVLDFAALAKPEYGDRVLAITYVTGRYFGEELSTSEIHSFVENYKDQLPEVLAEAGALNALGQPIVQFRYLGGDGGVGASRMSPSAPGFGRGKGPLGFGEAGINPGGGKPGNNEPSDEDAFGPESWIYRAGKLPPSENRFFTYVPKWDEKLTDISQEIWAAQEDLWVQRELYKRVKLANDAVAHFTPADPKARDAKQAAKVLGTRDQWHKFSNFYWELELKIVDGGVLAKFKNLRPRRQSLDGLYFLVKFSNGEAQLFPPKGATLDSVPLAHDESWTTPNPIAMPPDTKLDGVFAVDQVLTWETAAIKRIEVLTVGAAGNGDSAVSQREAWKPLVPFKKKPEVKVEEAPKDDPKGPGRNMGPAAPGGMGQAPAATGVGKQGVLLDRYLEVTTELRKVPINLVLIVDPDHIAKVEKAFVESPLRFLTTQLMWQRCAVSLRPQEASTSSTTAADKGPAIGPKGMRGGFGLGGLDGYPGAGRPPADSSAGGGDEQENLELTIYGVITLYDRPGRPPEQNK
jgi:hypothetical protein